MSARCAVVGMWGVVGVVVVVVMLVVAAVMIVVVAVMVIVAPVVFATDVVVIVVVVLVVVVVVEASHPEPDIAQDKNCSIWFLTSPSSKLHRLRCSSGSQSLFGDPWSSRPVSIQNDCCTRALDR